MIITLLLLKLCAGQFTIVSPAELANDDVDYAYGTFGNPSVYGTYGKLKFWYPSFCSFSESFTVTDFIVIFMDVESGCDIFDWAYSVQQSGGGALILADSNWYLSALYSPSSFDSGEKINILVLAISEYQGFLYRTYENEGIWVTYKLHLYTYDNPIISYQLTSNYTMDKTFFNNLQDLINKLSLPANQVSLTIQYIQGTNYTGQQCINYDNTDYCMDNSSYATGSQILWNSIEIVNYFNSLQEIDSTLNDFIITVLDLYNTCEFDYSTVCISKIFNKYNIQMKRSIKTIGVYGYYSWGSNFSSFYYWK